MAFAYCMANGGWAKRIARITREEATEVGHRARERRAARWGGMQSSFGKNVCRWRVRHGHWLSGSWLLARPGAHVTVASGTARVIRLNLRTSWTSSYSRRYRRAWLSLIYSFSVAASVAPFFLFILAKMRGKCAAANESHTISRPSIAEVSGNASGRQHSILVVPAWDQFHKPHRSNDSVANSGRGKLASRLTRAPFARRGDTRRRHRIWPRFL